MYMSRAVAMLQAARQQQAPRTASFLPFLPEDNGSLDNPASQEALSIINEDLAKLLKLKPAEFWQVAKTDRSLKECIDSYLRYCR